MWSCTQNKPYAATLNAAIKTSKVYIIFPVVPPSNSTRRFIEKWVCIRTQILLHNQRQQHFQLVSGGLFWEVSNSLQKKLCQRLYTESTHTMFQAAGASLFGSVYNHRHSFCRETLLRESIQNLPEVYLPLITQECSRKSYFWFSSEILR